jgi:hypothetical protein
MVGARSGVAWVVLPESTRLRRARDAQNDATSSHVLSRLGLGELTASNTRKVIYDELN